MKTTGLWVENWNKNKTQRFLLSPYENDDPLGRFFMLSVKAVLRIDNIRVIKRGQVKGFSYTWGLNTSIDTASKRDAISSLYINWLNDIHHVYVAKMFGFIFSACVGELFLCHHIKSKLGNQPHNLDMCFDRQMPLF